MAVIDAKWRKSSYSGGNGGNCVEVGTLTGHVFVRDTTDRDGVAMRVPSDAWHQFTAQLKAAS